jgi:hypothetical protein
MIWISVVASGDLTAHHGGEHLGVDLYQSKLRNRSFASAGDGDGDRSAASARDQTAAPSKTGE